METFGPAGGLFLFLLIFIFILLLRNVRRFGVFMSPLPEGRDG